MPGKIKKQQHFSGLILVKLSVCPVTKDFIQTVAVRLQSVETSGGVLPYSLGGGVPLGSQTSYSLLDQILQIL